jgi:cell division protein FtsI/penicillin-binding protein 2
MMRATVTEGAGRALRDIPGEPHAKTGTAEFGTENPPRTHAWMIGYQGDRDLAWSVLLEDGGSGGADAGPIAAEFLQNLVG